MLRSDRLITDTVHMYCYTSNWLIRVGVLIVSKGCYLIAFSNTTCFWLTLSRGIFLYSSISFQNSRFSSLCSDSRNCWNEEHTMSNYHQKWALKLKHKCNKTESHFAIIMQQMFLTIRLTPYSHTCTLHTKYTL